MLPSQYLDDSSPSASAEECDRSPRRVPVPDPRSNSRPPDQDPPAWNFNCKQAFLTYSKCPLSAQQLYEALTALSTAAGKDVLGATIGEEEHKDGTPHLHCAIRWASKWHCRNARFLDVTHEEVVYHPNIKRVKGYKRAQAYATKHGNYHLFGTDTVGRSYLALAREGKYTEAVEAFAEQHPLSYVQNLWKVESHLRILSQRAIGTGPPPFDLSTFELPEGVERWQRDHRTSHTLVLCGPPRLGKTSLARALLPGAIVANSIEGLRRCRDATAGLIVDDADLRRLSDVCLTALCDRALARDLPARYTDIHIPAETPMIICCNDFPIDWNDPMNDDQKRAVCARCKFVFIDKHLKKD